MCVRVYVVARIVGEQEKCTAIYDKTFLIHVITAIVKRGFTTADLQRRSNIGDTTPGKVPSRLMERILPLHPRCDQLIVIRLKRSPAGRERETPSRRVVPGTPAGHTNATVAALVSGEDNAQSDQAALKALT